MAAAGGREAVGIRAHLPEGKQEGREEGDPAAALAHGPSVEYSSDQRTGRAGNWARMGEILS